MTTIVTQPWIVQGDDGAPMSRVPAGVEYHRVYATHQVGARERRGILRGVAAIALLVVGLIGFAVLLDGISIVLDRELFGRSGPSTPLKQAAGALSLALLIPYCMLLQRLIYGVPPRSLHSVAGRFRYGVFGRVSSAPFHCGLQVRGRRWCGIQPVNSGRDSPWTGG